MSTVETEVLQQSEEQELTNRMKLEDKILKYFQNKEIAKERSEENKLLYEEIEALFEGMEDEEIIIPLANGENAVLTPQIREKETLDKDLLAEEMQVPKDELKTPFDFCMFTSQGKLTPAMITKFTTVEREIKLRLSKRKASSKRSKKAKLSPSEVE